MSFLRSLFGGGKPDVAQLAADRDVEALIEALGYQRDASIRRAAADALGTLGDQRAKTALHAALEDDDTAVRVAAQSALGKLVKDA